MGQKKAKAAEESDRFVICDDALTKVFHIGKKIV
jgi:hypothetical protein